MGLNYSLQLIYHSARRGLLKQLGVYTICCFDKILTPTRFADIHELDFHYRFTESKTWPLQNKLISDEMGKMTQAQLCLLGWACLSIRNFELSSEAMDWSGPAQLTFIKLF